MPLQVQRATLDLIAQVTGGKFESETPDWLMRPGKAECGRRWPIVCQIYRELTGQDLADVMPRRDRRKIDGMLKIGNDVPRLVEIDESQHFNLHRRKTLLLYPAEVAVAFDPAVWANNSKGEPRQKSGGWAAPKPPLFPDSGGRHLQRAFRDALADILPPEHGFLPTLRIGYFEVLPWINEADASDRMAELLDAKFRAEAPRSRHENRHEPPFDHTGSTFDSFLEEEGILEEVQAVAIKRVIAWQLSEAMKAGKINKKAMAERMGTSRSQLDRLLDPKNSAVNLETIAKAARAVGKRVRLEMVDAA